jgi:hypothetical protein
MSEPARIFPDIESSWSDPLVEAQAERCQHCPNAEPDEDTTWCTADPGRLWNTASLTSCPVVVDGEAPATNSEAFGCRSCESRAVRDGRLLCSCDPQAPRDIETWGFCPKSPEKTGPVAGWRQSLTSKARVRPAVDREDPVR